MTKRVLLLLGVCATVLIFSTLFGSLDAMTLVVNDYAQYYFFHSFSNRIREWP